MGVPKFAAWLIKKYPTMVETSCPRNVHGLYIDLNGIIHPCCHDEDDVSVAQRPDEEKLEAICRAVELLVVTTNPRELCYIAIDGVAPRAKMNQQRARRYMKSAVEQVNLDELANCTKEEYADTKNELDDVLCEMEAEMQSMGVPTQPMSHGAATRNCVKEDTRAEFDSNCLSPGTEFMTKVASSLRTFVEKKVASDDTLWRQLTFILSDTTIPGEGEHKFMDFMRTQTGRVGFGNNGAHVIVGLDADLIFLSLALHIPNVYILRDNDRHPTKPSSSSKKEDVELEGNDDDERRDVEDAAVTPCKKYEYFNIDTIGTLLVSEIYQLSIAKHFAMRGNPRAEGELQSSSGYAFDRVGGKATGELKGVSTVMHVPCPLSDPAGWMAATMANAGHSQAFHPCTATTNAKIVDDFIVLGMLLGNDFLPRSPTIFCGEGALDTLIELYVTEVLPFGYLTLGSHEINLIQLRRLFESLAKVEAAQFRRYAVLSGEMKGSDMPVGLTWPVREEWRRVYHTTTSIGDSASDACKAYIEGLRFVWRYYSSNSDRVSWSWFYNYHHAPLAVDVVDFLRAAGDNLQTTLAPPPLEVDPPTPLCQLLCILPPSSRALVPAVFSSIMQQPPPALASTFPSAWSVDFSASFGKEHLSTVMLPFASMEDLRALVATHVAELTEEEVGRLLTTGTTATVISRLPMGHESSQSTSLTKYEVYGGVGGILEPENVPRMEGEEEGDKQPVYRYRYLMGLPECTRPRTYSWKAVIPGFNAPPNRDFGNRFRKRKGGKTETEEESPKKNNKSDDELERSMAMTFPEFLMACGAISIVMLMMAHCQFIVLLQALAVVVVALWLTGFAGLMGVYTHSKAHDALRRNYNVRRLFMDWQCPLCLQINYSRNARCFVCEAPLDAARLVCIYSGKPTSFNAKQQDPDPPLLDPNHSTYMKHFIQGG